MSPRDPQIPAPDLVLRPLTARVMRHASYGTVLPVVAMVTFPVRSDSWYGHANVTIGMQCDDGRMVSGEQIEITYQRHPSTAADDARLQRTKRDRVAGFMGARDRRWSASYAGRIEVRIDHLRLGDSLPSKAHAMVMRALDAARARLGWRMPQCDLLRLIVGLRLIGVRVEIYSASLAAARAARPARPPRAVRIAPRRISRKRGSHAA